MSNKISHLYAQIHEPSAYFKQSSLFGQKQTNEEHTYSSFCLWHSFNVYKLRGWSWAIHSLFLLSSSHYGPALLEWKQMPFSLSVSLSSIPSTSLTPSLPISRCFFVLCFLCSFHFSQSPLCHTSYFSSLCFSVTLTLRHNTSLFI